MSDIIITDEMVTRKVLASRGALDREKARQQLQEEARIAEEQEEEKHLQELRQRIKDAEAAETEEDKLLLKKPDDASGGPARSLSVLKGMATRARNAANAAPGDAALQKAAEDAEAAVAAAQA